MHNVLNFSTIIFVYISCKSKHTTILFLFIRDLFYQQSVAPYKVFENLVLKSYRKHGILRDVLNFFAKFLCIYLIKETYNYSFSFFKTLIL